MSYGLNLAGISGVSLSYDIPGHLQGVSNIDELRKRDLEKLDGELRQEGLSLDEKVALKSIWRMKFPGMILDVRRINRFRQGIFDLIVSPIHPHRADLAFSSEIQPNRPEKGQYGDRTLVRNAAPLTVNSVVIDKDGNVVLGIRGGDVGAGHIAVVPGGHAEYTPPNLVYNPRDVLFEEGQEELGQVFQKTLGQRVVSLMDNKDTNGINVLYAARIDAGFEEIEESWRKAKDRYEHSGLVKVSFKDLRELGDTGKLKGKGETTAFFRDCFRYVCELEAKSL